MAEIPKLWDVFVGIASLLGTCLAILTFYLQYGSRIRRAISGRGPFSGKIVALNTLFSEQVSKIQNIRFVSGCTLALLAALLWSISYNSFRSDALADLDPLWVSATIAFFGAITIFVLALLASIRERGKLDAPILRPLFTKNGAVIVFANAFEFWFFLLAVTLTTAGNTIALYKMNPMWMLILLFFLNKEKAGKASIAAVFCVLLGGGIILSPHITGEFNLAHAKGSTLAILGGIFFAVYSISFVNYPVQYSQSSLKQRLMVLSTVFLFSCVLLIGIAALTKTAPNYSREAFPILIFNGVRVGVVYIFYTEAIKRIHPVLVASIVALEVPLTMIIEFFWFGQVLSQHLIFGSIIIIISILSIMKENDMFIQRIETK